MYVPLKMKGSNHENLNYFHRLITNYVREAQKHYPLLYKLLIILASHRCLYAHRHLDAYKHV
jgi:hypothetical protein